MTTTTQSISLIRGLIATAFLFILTGVSQAGTLYLARLSGANRRTGRE